ncbi:hypothetical protein EV359DRAFT_26995, partial [Lentinula novae-zelandiae]
REHILRACPRYEESWYILRKGSNYMCPLHILGSKSDIEATSFYNKSGAFTRTG